MYVKIAALRVKSFILSEEARNTNIKLATACQVSAEVQHVIREHAIFLTATSTAC